MNAPAAPEATRLPLSEARIADDVFADMRRDNLARWPTGADVDFDQAVELHRSLPRHKQLGWVMRQAVGRTALPDAAARRASARSTCTAR